MARYIALIDGDDGNYGVVFPDLPGCYSGAPTLDGTLPMAIEAARLWAESMASAGNPIPEPRGLETLRNDPDYAEAFADGAIVMLVPLLLDAGRAARANISMDAGLLASIDEAAGARGITRSAFLAGAAREKIASEG